MIGDLIEWIFVVGIMYGVVGTLVLQGIIIIAYHLIGRVKKEKATEKMAEETLKAMQETVKRAMKEAGYNGKQRKECKEEHKNS